MRVGSKGHSYVTLEEPKSSPEKVQCVSRPHPLFIMAFTIETDKPRVEATDKRPARKLKTSKTHCCKDNMMRVCQ